MKKKSKLTRFILGIFISIVILLFSLIIRDRIKVQQTYKNVALIKLGDAKNTVKNIMGSPSEIFPKRKALFWGMDPEEWAYGSTFQFKNCFSKKFPYFFPFRLRIFGTDKNEISIVFDDKGNVQHIKNPQ
jgi:hypothetical protein